MFCTEIRNLPKHQLKLLLQAPFYHRSLVSNRLVKGKSGEANGLKVVSSWDVLAEKAFWCLRATKQHTG